jgi:hypothetical protein
VIAVKHADGHPTDAAPTVTMFQASHRHAFLDYFRIPYEVTGQAAGAGAPEGTPAFVGRLQSVSDDGNRGGTLLWVRARARAQLGNACIEDRYRLGTSMFAGHVLPDRRSAEWLPLLGAGWRPTEPIHDERGARVASVWRDEAGNVFLPFDIGEVMENFWSERYRDVGRTRTAAAAKAALLRGYYLAKPLIPRNAQLALRRGFTRVQDRATFPRWPVEDSLHDLYAWLLDVLAEVRGGPVPWLDMWPDGRTWALVLTHDVETEFGYRNMHLLRDAERAAGYRSSWNFVPERYQVEPAVLRQLRNEGCEIGVHGLRHDGRDLGSRSLFEERLPAIRGYADRWQAVGFRSPATQRVWEWMPELGFDYDSSFTDTDPYEPQPGGCCSYLPFFNEELVELPITLPQDHTLFAILQDARGDVWVDKARHLRERGGMALALVHPDYATDPRLVGAWNRLLDEFRDDDLAWQALPAEVSDWWRRRAASTLRRDRDGWRVVGPAARDGNVRIHGADAPLRISGAVS